MNAQQSHALRIRGTDIEGALQRMCGNEATLTLCLRAFLEDRTTAELNDAIAAHCWDDAFTAAHALKGVAGNMGFIPLMHKTAQLIILIRRGSISDMPPMLAQVNSSYRDIVDGIHQFLKYTDETVEGEQS